MNILMIMEHTLPHYFIEVFQNLVARLQIILFVMEYHKIKILRDGDILNVDVTAIKNGWHGDTSRMFLVGDVSVKAKKLIKVTYESMIKGIETLKEGSFTGDIG